MIIGRGAKTLKREQQTGQRGTHQVRERACEYRLQSQLSDQVTFLRNEYAKTAEQDGYG